MKFLASDALATLRRFGVAGDDNVPRNIERIEHANPSPINQLVTFRFGKTQYALLLDETAEDDEKYIISEIKKVIHQDGEVLKNPTSDLMTYGLPYKGKDLYLYRIDTGKQRLDSYLASTYPDTSRSSWQKHIKAGHISVNNRVVTAPKYDVAADDTVSIDLPDAPDYTDRELPIIYIDDDIIVIDKPIGILTHARHPLDTEFTVAEFMRRYTTVELDSDRPGIVHRLDRDTSGVIVGARTTASYDHLKAQFSERTAQKTYIAITDGIPKQSELRIDIPIGRNPSQPGTFRADPHGKPAQTHMKTLATNTHHAKVELQPHTGRTHQLRVHMAYIGAPIHGDRVYGKPADRLYLHAHKLTITLADGTSREFVSPLPSEFDELLESDS